jgi:hypothetical protein
VVFYSVINSFATDFIKSLEEFNSEVVKVLDSWVGFD